MAVTHTLYPYHNIKPFWFAFHPSQQAVLHKYPKAWVAFGCGSERTIIFVPLQDFLAWLPLLNKTDLEERSYWHVIIEKEGFGQDVWRHETCPVRSLWIT
jgi:hypothetical protein